MLMNRAAVAPAFVAMLAIGAASCGGIGAAARPELPTGAGAVATESSQASQVRATHVNDAAPTDDGSAVACAGVNRPGLLPLPKGATFAATFATTPEGLGRWRAGLLAQSGAERIGSATGAMQTPDIGAGTVYICYADGDFGRPRGNPPDSMPDYSRIILVILPNGTIDIPAMGFADSLPIINPNE